ncbi:MAG: OB-fold protein [Bacteroidota bacterium]
MTTPHSAITKTQWLHLFFGVMLVASFFLPWVDCDGKAVNGSALAAGTFFKISQLLGGPDNPFPQFSFSFYLFWLIPVLGVLCPGLVVLKKKTVPFSFFAGTLSLALVTVYLLFSNVLLTLGLGKGLGEMLKPAAYVHALAAVGLIVTAFPVKTVLPKLIWLILGPVVAYASFRFGEKYVMGETHKATTEIKADFTVRADSLISEFIVNDTAANKKYLEKVLVVNGNASAVDIMTDSTSTIRFADSTGSYAIFALEKDQLEEIKKLSTGDAVSVKGVCSGSIFSEILGTTSINFKRSTLNK